MSRGAFIVIEGIDGAGTTTQVQRLVAALASDGVQAHATREPSDGPVGRLLREILTGSHKPVDATTMALLFAADRADHLQREVEPALAAGTVVVSDRYYHSSLAYQGTGEERAFIEQLNARARTPDLTLFLRVDPDVAASRRAARGQSEELYERLELQRKIAAGYDAIVAALSGRETIVVVDGAGSLDEVFAEVKTHARKAIEARR